MKCVYHQEMDCVGNLDCGKDCFEVKSDSREMDTFSKDDIENLSDLIIGASLLKEIYREILK